MTEPDTLPYYFVLFGTILLAPLLMIATGLLMGKAINQRSRKLWMVSLLPLLGAFLAVFANPVFNSLLFVPGSNARVAAMYEEASSEGFVGKSFVEFAERFGTPDRSPLRSPDRSPQFRGTESGVFVYTCRPWFAYGWDELIVRTEEGMVVGMVIDD